MTTLASQISLSLPRVLDLAFPKSQPRLPSGLPLQPPLHSGVPRLKGYVSSIFPQTLGFSTLATQNHKSYFTPVCASVRARGMTPSFWSRSPCLDRPPGGCCRAAIPSPHPFLARPTGEENPSQTSKDQSYFLWSLSGSCFSWIISSVPYFFTTS